jgi:hypothetical protein
VPTHKKPRESCKRHDTVGLDNAAAIFENLTFSIGDCAKAAPTQKKQSDSINSARILNILMFLQMNIHIFMKKNSMRSPSESSHFPTCVAVPLQR